MTPEQSAKLSDLVSKSPADRIDVYRWIRGSHEHNFNDLINLAEEIAESELSPTLITVSKAIESGLIQPIQLTEINNPRFLSVNKTAIKAWSEDGVCYSVFKTSTVKRSTDRSPGEDLSENEGITLNVLSRTLKELRQQDPEYIKAQELQREKDAETQRRQRRMQEIPALSSDFNVALGQLADWAEDFAEFKEALSPSMFDLSDRNRTRLGRALMAIEDYKSVDTEHVTVYRALPPGKDIESGDWVTLNESYAKRHAEYSDDDLVVESRDVSGDEVFWADADENEFVYVEHGTWSIESVEELWESYHPQIRNEHTPEVRPSEKPSLKPWGIDTSRTYYHGTAREFSTFDLGFADDKLGMQVGMGWGPNKFYFTEYPENAENSAQYAEQNGRGDAQNIHPVHLTTSKVIDGDEYSDRLRVLVDSHNGDRRQAVQELDQQIADEGYDAIVSESGGIAVFSPEQIVSVFDQRLAPEQISAYEALIKRAEDMGVSEDSVLTAIRQNNIDTSHPVFHGTGNKDQIEAEGFDHNLTGQGIDQLGSGFYFTAKQKEAQGYMAQASGSPGADSPGIIKRYLSVQNPITVKYDENGVASLKYDITLEQAISIISKAPRIYDEDESPLGDIYDIWSEGITAAHIEEVAESYIGHSIFRIENDFYSEEGESQQFRDALAIATKHDGVVIPELNHYVAWNNDQIWSEDRILESALEIQKVADLSLTEESNMNSALYLYHSLNEEKLKHNLKHFGKELLSPSLALANQYSTDFGDICFVFPETLLSEKNVRTFSSDIYSPRHPAAIPSINTTKLKGLDNLLAETPEAKALSAPSVDDLENDYARLALAHNHLFKAYALRNSGVDIEIPKRNVAKHSQVITDLLETMRFKDVLSDDRVKAALNEHYTQQIELYKEISNNNNEDPKEIDDTVQMLKSQFFDDGENVTAGIIFKHAREAQTAASNSNIDTAKLKNAIDDAVSEYDLRGKINEMAEDIIDDMAKDYYFSNGRDSRGKTRKSKYSKTNVLKHLKQNLRGGENFNYGAGSVRSAYSHEFKNVSEAYSHSNMLVDKETFKAAKKESNDRLLSVIEQLKPYYKYDSNSMRYTDDATAALSEGYKGWHDAFDLTPGATDLIHNFVQYLRDLPTEYFEVKVAGVLDVSNASGVIVPDNLSDKSKAFIDTLNIPVVTLPSQDVAGRTRALAEISSGILNKSIELQSINHLDLKDSDVTIKLQKWSQDIVTQNLVGFEPNKAEYSLIISEAIKHVIQQDSEIVVVDDSACVAVPTDHGTVFLNCNGARPESEIESAPTAYSPQNDPGLIRESGISYKLAQSLKELNLPETLNQSVELALAQGAEKSPQIPDSTIENTVLKNMSKASSLSMH